MQKFVLPKCSCSTTSSLRVTGLWKQNTEWVNGVFIGLRVLSVLFADSVLSFLLLDLFAVFICKHVLRKSQKQ